MFYTTTIPYLFALWTIGFTILVGAAPLAVRASMATGLQSSEDPQGPILTNNEGGQVRLSAPPLMTTPLSPPPPPPSPPSSNASRPLSFVLPKWVTAPYPRSLKAVDMEVFNTILQGITLAKKHSAMGNNNAGVYSVASFDPSFAQLFPPSISAQNIDPSRLLVKVLKHIDDDMVAEVKALKTVGQFVASGLLKLPTARSNELGKMKRGIRDGKVRRDAVNYSLSDDDSFELKPVIVMLKMPGKPLTHTPEFISEKNLETKRQMMSDTLTMMCDRVGKLALEHRFVHRDNIIGNILVINEGSKIVDVNIIDWGGKYLSSIKDDVTWDDLMGWCHNRWAVYVWEDSL
ncbi:hypothetical protein GGU10DRAFT_389838 [Lentinula aff. detonsa]|uniref:Protein kinase domain-containing protein n=1 Tax=Lentinula aff. detonsa TaxID=2804958 RepID=A0AA38KM17_9AGAR|nr:hypothetical protein GGU10DRAFT_389838 [Lentinula aff. detonsa]